MIKWVVRLFNLCFIIGVVPKEWCEASTVPLYKGKGDKYECGSYRSISLLSVVGKLLLLYSPHPRLSRGGPPVPQPMRHTQQSCLRVGGNDVLV